jgi:rSAM/selenodomain-associated transferase 2
MFQPHDNDSRISVIVPVVNEQEQLATTLSYVQLAPGDELIVVDGGSTDQTLEIARKFTPDVLSSPPGRARQMNLGAAHATGDILLFLHADTLLPPESANAIRHAMRTPEVTGGAFRLVINPTTPALRLIAWGANLRSRFAQLPYGDQALFVRRHIFEALGGYADEPFLEDVQLVRAMRRYGRVILVPHAVQTSGRRWLQEGVVYTTVRNNVVVGLFFCGVAPVTLKRWYTDWHRRRR